MVTHLFNYAAENEPNSCMFNLLGKTLQSLSDGTRGIRFPPKIIELVFQFAAWLLWAQQEDQLAMLDNHEEMLIQNLH